LFILAAIHPQIPKIMLSLAVSMLKKLLPQLDETIIIHFYFKKNLNFYY